jgi:hypothetical protein
MTTSRSEIGMVCQIRLDEAKKNDLYFCRNVTGTDLVPSYGNIRINLIIMQKIQKVMILQTFKCEKNGNKYSAIRNKVFLHIGPQKIYILSPQ